jgi:RNA polymerase sigma factor (sigma-70 family)
MAAIPLADRPRRSYNQWRTVAVTCRPQEGTLMSPADPVTLWIDRLKAGDRESVRPLWERYFRRMVGLARQRLRAAPRRLADEEDVALSAFDSFCRCAAAGRFPRLDDRDDLWQVLVMITLRKAADQARHERRQKRGGGQVARASELDEEGTSAFAKLIAREPDPAVAAELADGCRRLLDALDNDTLRKIAVAKMEGDSNEQIAERLNVSLATVERKLRGIRGILEKVWRSEG